MRGCRARKWLRQWERKRRRQGLTKACPATDVVRVAGPGGEMVPGGAPGSWTGAAVGRVGSVRCGHGVLGFSGLLASSVVVRPARGSAHGSGPPWGSTPCPQSDGHRRWASVFALTSIIPVGLPVADATSCGARVSGRGGCWTARLRAASPRASGRGRSRRSRSGPCCGRTPARLATVARARSPGVPSRRSPS